LKLSTMIKMTAVASVSDISFGLYAQPKESGSAAYLQVRQFSHDGRLTTQADEYINLDKKTEPRLLKEGDVLFVGKGNRLFSWCYTQSDQPAVASSIFFVLRPDHRLIYPEYLAAILNAPQSKATFQQIGGGTNIFSIRKSELGAFQIPLPRMQQQKRIAALAALHRQEIELSQKLIAEKQKLYTAIISKLIK
jgi:restriction endonuclease S subunit